MITTSRLVNTSSRRQKNAAKHMNHMRLSVGACESVSVSNSKRAFHSCLTEISATDEEDRLSLYFLQVTSTHDPNNRPTVHADSLPMPRLEYVRA